jgi:3-phosphoglycerate kinase
MEKGSAGLGITPTKDAILTAFANKVCLSGTERLYGRAHIDITPDTDEEIAAMIRRRERIVSNGPR